MVDWMMEVLHVFKCENETIFLAILIMDLYLNKVKIPTTKENLHLIGTTSIYMASKFEDITPISVSHVVNKISHGKFKPKQVVEIERNIFSTIEYNVILASPYEFIKTYIYDFLHNNERKINKLQMKNHVNNLEGASIYMAKLMCHNDSFSQYK